MTTKEADALFNGINLGAFIAVYQLSNQDRLFFLEYVINKKRDVWDENGTAQAHILDTLELFNNNPEDFKERVEQATQLKLL